MACLEDVEKTRGRVAPPGERLDQLDDAIGEATLADHDRQATLLGHLL
jgi:hypothetical protein